MDASLGSARPIEAARGGNAGHVSEGGAEALEVGVVSLHEAPELASRVGGKAAPLMRAIAAGHSVPEGVVLPVELSGSSREVIEAALRPHLARLGERLAVRSSGVAEDGAARSFAGQLHTELDIAPLEVPAAVERCVHAASSLRALRYGGEELAPVAIIVQRLVRADHAGVAFGADPRTGERDVVRVEAVRGLGEALVSGAQTPEAWRISGGEAKREHGPEVLTPAQAQRVAELTRALGELFGAPQDVEWAFEGETLYLLQSRPITALPAAPIAIELEIPGGTWERDDHHGVLSPLGWHWFQPYPAAMGDAMRSCGMPIERLEPRRIGGHLYMQMVMGGGDGPEPPAWVLWLVTRLLPSMRRANRAAEKFWDDEQYWASIDAWESADREKIRRAVDDLYLADPSSLDDEALLARIGAALEVTAEGLRLHAWLGGGPMFALGKLAMHLEDHLGWSPDRALSLVTGASPATTSIDVEVGELVKQHEQELRRATALRWTWAGLAASCPQLSTDLLGFVETHRLRMLHYEPRFPMLGERPELVLGIAEAWASRLLDGDTQGSRRTVDDADTALVELRGEAASKLDAEGLAELERLLEGAKRGYAIRDANGIDTVSRPVGLLRHFVLELGRRLGSALDAPEHAVYLEPSEHRDALAGSLGDVRARVERRRGEESWALVNRGPAHYGKKPSMPPVDAFPLGLRRMMRVFAWMDRLERGAYEHEGECLRGYGVGAGRAEGRVRIVDHPEQLVRLRVGEIVVCRITSPEWSIALGRVGALVTEEGGALSHPAIIAREFGVPAVVGVEGARARLRDGDEVVVDAARGTVTRIGR